MKYLAMADFQYIREGTLVEIRVLTHADYKGGWYEARSAQGCDYCNAAPWVVISSEILDLLLPV